VSGHRTACAVVHNTTAEDFSVENPVKTALGHTNNIGVPAGGHETFWCSELFWECADDNEIRVNALRFRWGDTYYKNGFDSFYMFMQKTTMNIMWTRMGGGTYDNAMQVYAGRNRAGCLDVWIWRDPTQEVPHGTPWYYPTAVLHS
jgi:hypothetical protein